MKLKDALTKKKFVVTSEIQAPMESDNPEKLVEDLNRIKGRVDGVSVMEVELEGIVARLPPRDLAIVKLKDPPRDLTILDIGHEGDVPLGEEVFAFGHPYDAEFSLSKGIVSRILTTKEWSRGSRKHLLTRLRAPEAMEWIQHDAKISPGNSGGPLIGEKDQVYGLNTFVHVKAEFGYASMKR